MVNGQWIDAVNLSNGDKLLNADSSNSTVISVEVVDSAFRAFNLSVVDFHTYFVSAPESTTAYWVHNICGSAFRNNPEKLKNLQMDMANSPALAAALRNDPEIATTWNHWDDLGETKMRQQFQDIVDNPSQRPVDPSDYLSPTYLANYQAKFDDGIVRFTTQEKINSHSGTLGGPDTFIMARSEYNKLWRETGGDFAKIEDKLGLNPGDLTGGTSVIAWVKKADMPPVRMTNGLEAGANNKWRPGGITINGFSEGIVDLTTQPNWTPISY